MRDARNEHRLAAILAADAVGYSRLMGADEDGTVAALRSHRAEVFEPQIAGHNGRLFKTTGDGFLVEFPSVVAAVACALSIQEKMAERNDGVAQARKMLLRIGVHLGDVVVENDDLVGDVVNVVTRLESIAEPGNVCLSDAAHRQVVGKIDTEFVDGGVQTLKNIAVPMRVWRTRQSAAGPREPGRRRPMPSLPARPSLAVLPFTNMSGDPEQEYFADGMVEDIITALSRVGWFFVIARNSSFVYKGKAVDIKQVGRELGVRYVLEGSVRKAGGRVRITGQLIEAESGTHVWANRYDGSLDDIFELQDKITESVVSAIEPQLQLAEIARAKAKPTENLDAYDLYLRALPRYYSVTRAGYDDALHLLKLAIEADPAFSLAKSLLALLYSTRQVLGWAEPGDEEIALALAREAIAASHDDPATLRGAAHVLAYYAKDYGVALAAAGRALLLNPNSAHVVLSSAWVYNFAGEPEKAVVNFQRAMALSPLDPEIFSILSGLAIAYLMMGKDEEGLMAAQACMRERPSWVLSYRLLALGFIRAGRIEEGRAAGHKVMELDPNFRVSKLLLSYRNANFERDYRDALRQAGIPE